MTTMQHTNFGFFTRGGDFASASTQWFTAYGFINEAGEDWYELRAGLTTWGDRGQFIDAVYGAWVTLDADGVVVNVEFDPSRLMPSDKTVLGLDMDPADIAVGMIWDGAEFVTPAPIEEPSTARPCIIVNGVFAISDGLIEAVSSLYGVAFAFAMGPDTFWIFFNDMQPDLAYSCTVGSSSGQVNVSAPRQTTHIEIVTTGITTPAEVSIQVIRVQ